MSGKNNNLKQKYGGFVLAATAYITGVLLFSFWSYFAHQKELTNRMDETLLHAAFSMQEILDGAFTETPAASTATNPEVISGKQPGLTRLAHHGKFRSVEVVFVSNDIITPLIVGLNPNQTSPENITSNHLPHPLDLEKALVRLATAGNDDTYLITAAHPNAEEVRYAIRFTAERTGYGIAYLVAQDRKIIKQELADQALRLFAAGLGMLFLAIPLISFFSRTQKKAAEELSSMNNRLQHDVDLQQSREEELKDAISDLERFNAVSTRREMRIIELKAEVNKLLQQTKCEKRYNIDKID